jgi:hypothetical protein
MYRNRSNSERVTWSVFQKETDVQRDASHLDALV